MAIRWQPNRARLGQIMSVIILVAITLLGAYEGILFIANRSTSASTAGVECTVKPSDEIITYFYKVGTTNRQRSELAQHIHGIIRDQYLALHGTSLVVPVAQYQTDLAYVRQSSFVISASSSQDQGCQDPD